MSGNPAPGGPADDRPGGPPDPDHRAIGSTPPKDAPGPAGSAVPDLDAGPPATGTGSTPVADAPRPAGSAVPGFDPDRRPATGAPVAGGRHASGRGSRRVPVLAAVGVVLVLVAGGIGVRAAAGSSGGGEPALATAQPTAAQPSEPAPTTKKADGSWGPVTNQSPVAAPTDRTADGVAPTGVRIPAIGVDATSLVPLAIMKTGELEAPEEFDRTGWYANGPVPGEPGPAVIAAHVDSRAGPAVFFRLKELKPGDKVYVPRSDGVTVTFTVTGVERYPKNAFPTQKVHGPTPDRALRLITCGGSFDYAKRSYRDNIVVYAVRA